MIDYHLGKANVVADALSRKERLNELVELRRMGIDLEFVTVKGLLANLVV